MKLRRKRKTLSVPLFSTSDIAFLLLIFIMLVSLINYRQVVRIEYPEADTALRVSDENNLEIWIDRTGGLYLDGIPSNLQLVQQGIVDAYIQSPGTRVHIIADRNTAFENIHSVLEILQLLQYRVVSFVVRNE
ncbi:MAG: biopolymer transporter ExbD [Treponema sp.]|nr:biopolymer transporter ExbD [Treponema sp.]